MKYLKFYEMKYETAEDCAEDILEVLSEREHLDLFDNLLNEVFPEYAIGDLCYTPSHILRDCDPLAYHELMFKWLDARRLNVTEELEDFIADDSREEISFFDTVTVSKVF